jgi:hypothetical protein
VAALGIGRQAWRSVRRHPVYSAFAVGTLAVVGGVAIAAGATRLAASPLYGISARDPLALRRGGRGDGARRPRRMPSPALRASRTGPARAMHG